MNSLAALRSALQALAANTLRSMLTMLGIDVLRANGFEIAPDGSRLVTFDDFEGARLATDHLLQLGHRLVRQDLAHHLGHCLKLAQMRCRRRRPGRPLQRWRHTACGRRRTEPGLI